MPFLYSFLTRSSAESAGESPLLPVWVSALPLWEWYPIPNTALSSVDPSPQALGGSGPASKIEAWCGATLKRFGSVYMLGAAGGHGDYAGNEVDAITLNTATPAWTQLRAPSANSEVINFPAQYYLDLRPAPTHTYYGTHFIESINKMFVLGIGGLFGTSFPPMPGGWPYVDDDQGVYSYNVAAGDWDPPETAASMITMGGDSTAQMIVKHQITDDIYMGRGGSGWDKWTAATNTWTHINGNYEQNYAGSAIDPNRNRMLIVGDYAGIVAPRVRDLNGDYVSVTFGGLGPDALKIPVAYPGIVYDEINDKFLVFYNSPQWDSPGSVVEVLRVDAATFSVDAPTITGTKPIGRKNGIQNSVQYVPELGGIVIANKWNDNVMFMRTSNAGISKVTSFELTSTSTGTQPFPVGLALKKGDIPGVPVILGTPDAQVIVKNRWNDGSVKTAIASGLASLTANTPLTLNVMRATTAPSGTDLTAGHIASAAPSASIQIGSIGTVNLSSLLATPSRTWISGPKMVEAHYRSNVGSDATLCVWFHVRLYAGGRMWIRAIVENGYLDVTKADKTYIPTITIGGTVVYNNGGSSLTHYAYTRYAAEGWIGGDPAVTPAFDVDYLTDTKLVPNYWKHSPSSGALDGLTKTYVQMSNGDISALMGNTGFQLDIGLLPNWDALFVASGDARAYRSVLANASSLNSYPIVWRDSSTHLVPKPSDWPHFSIDGGTYNYQAGSLYWEMNHAPSEGYLAYLLTGDYWYYETVLMNTAINYLARNDSLGVGLDRLVQGETRGTAWSLRTSTQMAAIAVDGDDVADDYKTLLSNNIDHYKSVRDSVLGIQELGYLFEYSVDTYAPGTIAPWQQHFVIQSVGMGSDLEPLADMTNYNLVRDQLYKGAVGILGNSSGYCFTNASAYNAKIADGGNNDPVSWYPDWAAVYFATYEMDASGCANTLEGVSGGAPEAAQSGYWGNLLPAIAYAVDHGATGADAAWARLTGSTNWPVVENSGFDDLPVWGIVPRGTP